MGKANTKVPVARMTTKQAAAALDLAGWPKDQWVTGVAVGMAESGLDTTVENEIGADGWLQILKKAHPDLFKKLPNALAWYDPVTNAKMAKSVYTSAGKSWGPWAAYSGPDGSGSDGPYRTHLSDARAGVAAYEKDIAGLTPAQKKAYGIKLFAPISKITTPLQLGGAVQGVGNEIADAAETTGTATVSSGNAVVDAVGEIGREMAAFSNFFQALLLPGTWLRIGAGLVGAVLIVGGVVALGKEAAGQ
jgi:hypothetical protein